MAVELALEALLPALESASDRREALAFAVVGLLGAISSKDGSDAFVDAIRTQLSQALAATVDAGSGIRGHRALVTIEPPRPAIVVPKHFGKFN
jgi:hypothetical protein